MNKKLYKDLFSEDNKYLYIGILHISINQFQRVLLCCSHREGEVYEYLLSVRGLNPDLFTVERLFIDSDSAMNIYNEYFLTRVKFLKNSYLVTNGDLSILNKELDRISDSLYSFRSQLEDIIGISSKDSTGRLYTLRSTLEASLNLFTNKKIYKRLIKIILEESPVFCKDIITYLQHIRMIQYDDDMRNEFLRKVYDDHE